MSRHFKSKWEFNIRNSLKEKTPMRILKKKIRQKMLKKYLTDKHTFNKKIITDIVFNEKTRIVASFKDYLIFDDLSEFLKRFYGTDESRTRLPKIIQYYVNYSKIFPNYTTLSEAKFIYKNIQKKQKVIDKMQKNEIIEKDKKVNFDEVSEKLINTEAYESIMNQSDSRDFADVGPKLKLIYKESIQQAAYQFQEDNTYDSIERLIENIPDLGKSNKGSEEDKIETPKENNSSKNFELILLEKKLKEIKSKSSPLDSNLSKNKADVGSTLCTANQGSTVANSRPLSSNKFKSINGDQDFLSARGRHGDIKSIYDTLHQEVSEFSPKLFKNRQTLKPEKIDQNVFLNTNKISSNKLKNIFKKDSKLIKRKDKIGQNDLTSLKDSLNQMKNNFENMKYASTTSRKSDPFRQQEKISSVDTNKKFVLKKEVDHIFMNKMLTIQHQVEGVGFSSSNREREKTGSTDKYIHVKSPDFKTQTKFKLDYKKIDKTSVSPFNTIGINTDRRTSSTQSKKTDIKPIKNSRLPYSHQKTQSIPVLDLKNHLPNSAVKIKPLDKQKFSSNQPTLTNRITSSIPKLNLPVNQIIPPLKNFKDFLNNTPINKPPNSDRIRSKVKMKLK